VTNGGLDLQQRPAVQRSFHAVSGELHLWQAIDSVLQQFTRVDLHKVFLFLVRNADLIEVLPDVIASLERHFGVGKPMSLRMIEDFAQSDRTRSGATLRIGLAWPGSIEKGQHLLSTFDDIWDTFFESETQGRVLVNYDY